MRQLIIRILVLTTVFTAITACGGGGIGGYGSSSSSGSGLVTRISITPATSSIMAGGMQQYTAVAKDSSGNTISGVTYNWTSSNNSAATIDSSGLASGVAAGTTTITASINYGGTGCTGPYCNGTGMAYTITSNGATLTVSGAAMVMGTVSSSSENSSAGDLVSITDATGQKQFTVADIHGHFSLSTSGLTSPFLLKAINGQGRPMYSLATADGTVNIDSFTDAITRLWYQSRGTTPDEAFSGFQDQRGIDLSSLNRLDRVLADSLASALALHALDANRISLFHTPFSTENMGLNAFIKQMEFSQFGAQVAIRDPDTGQTVTITATHHVVTVMPANPGISASRARSIDTGR